MAIINRIEEIELFSTINQNIWVLGWLLPFDKSIVKNDLKYKLQIDFVDTFDSGNIIEYNTGGNNPADFNILEIVGDISSGFQIDFKDFILEDLNYYIRIQIFNLDKNLFSNWSRVLILNRKHYEKKEKTDEMFNKLADKNTYNKDIFSTSSNIYMFFTSLIIEILNSKHKIDLVYKFKILKQCLFEYLEKYWGDFINVKRKNTKLLDYYFKLKLIIDSFIQYSSKQKGITDIVRAFVLEPPKVYDTFGTIGWILGERDPVTNERKIPDGTSGFFIFDPNNLNTNPIIRIWSRASKRAFEVILYNSWEIEYDKELMLKLLKENKPIFSRMNFSEDYTKLVTNYYYDDLNDFIGWDDVEVDWNNMEFV